MGKFVIINDELRLDDVRDFHELIGDNSEQEVKSKGSWDMDKKTKRVFFFGGLTQNDLAVLSSVKKCGFYSPLIQGYEWFFAENIGSEWIYCK